MLSRADATNWLLHTIALVEVETELTRLRAMQLSDAEVPHMRTYIAKVFQLVEELLPIPEKDHLMGQTAERTVTRAQRRHEKDSEYTRGS